MKPAAFQQAFLQNLADSRQLLDVMDQMTGALFMMKNRDSRYIYMSRALREAIQVPPGVEVVGRTDFDLFPKLVAEQYRQNDLKLFKSGRPLVREVHAATFPAGGARWFYSSKYPLHDRQGRVIGLMTIAEAYDQVMGQDAELNRLLPAIDHVTRHYSEVVTLADLAKRCGCSRTQFMRVFKKHLGMTAYAFVEQVRMHHALHALQHTSESIASLAVDCGFYDHSAFVKRFKKFTGTTPLKYRRTQQAKLETHRTLALATPGTMKRRGK